MMVSPKIRPPDYILFIIYVMLFNETIAGGWDNELERI
jgi:hypothetical protein